MTTGTGCWLMSLRKNVSPSMRGISMSSVMTSGASARIFSAAVRWVAHGGHDFDVRRGTENVDERLTHKSGIVDDEDADRFAHESAPFLT